MQNKYIIIIFIIIALSGCGYSPIYYNQNTNFNIVTPGGVFNGQNKKFIKKYSELIPKKKMASQEEIFSAIKFLIADDSKYVLGQNIYVDGGFSAW